MYLTSFKYYPQVQFRNFKHLCHYITDSFIHRLSAATIGKLAAIYRQPTHISISSLFFPQIQWARQPIMRWIQALFTHFAPFSCRFMPFCLWLLFFDGITCAFRLKQTEGGEVPCALFNQRKNASIIRWVGSFWSFPNLTHSNREVSELRRSSFETPLRHPHRRWVSAYIARLPRKDEFPNTQQDFSHKRGFLRRISLAVADFYAYISKYKAW